MHVRHHHGGTEPESFENLKIFRKLLTIFSKPYIIHNLQNLFGYKVYALGEYDILVIPIILKVWPSYIAQKRSFVAFTFNHMSGPTSFLVAQVYINTFREFT